MKPLHCLDDLGITADPVTEPTPPRELLSSNQTFLLPNTDLQKIQQPEENTKESNLQEHSNVYRPTPMKILLWVVLQGLFHAILKPFLVNCFHVYNHV